MAGTENAPVIRLVDAIILQQAVAEEASDVHVEPRARELVVRMRVYGVIARDDERAPKFQGGVTARLKILDR